ncbi:MAG TPA: hypothetical protein VMT93_04960 [Gemmatimonadaceae bacterium]|nr:hypothetical protein [Gemmatimonadaceae bacterium]
MAFRTLREGMRSGLVAAAATAGVLIGLGSAHGAALRPLNSVAHILIGSRAYYMEGADLLVTPLALLTHTASVMLWGVLLALATGRLTGPRLYGAALVFAGLTWIVDFRIVPDRLRPGFESGLSPVEVSLVYIVLAVSLAWALDRERRSAAAE